MSTLLAPRRSSSPFTHKDELSALKLVVQPLLTFGLIGPGAQDAGRSWRTVTAKDIQSKADVIRAFHQMALKPDRNSEEWWTHQKVVEELVEQKPDRSVQATVLSSLYEQARYLPEDMEFTPEQIRDAKLALTQCER